MVSAWRWLSYTLKRDWRREENSTLGLLGIFSLLYGPPIAFPLGYVYYQWRRTKWSREQREGIYRQEREMGQRPDVASIRKVDPDGKTDTQPLGPRTVECPHCRDGIDPSQVK